MLLAPSIHADLLRNQIDVGIEAKEIVAQMNQEEINVLAAKFNLTDGGNEPECFAEALTLCQKLLKRNKQLEPLVTEIKTLLESSLAYKKRGSAEVLRMEMAFRNWLKKAREAGF